MTEYYQDDPVFRVMISQDDLTSVVSDLLIQSVRMRNSSQEPQCTMDVMVPDNGHVFAVGSIVHLWVPDIGLAGRGMVTANVQGDEFKIRPDILLSKPISLEVLWPYYVGSIGHTNGELLDKKDAMIEHAMLDAVKWANSL